MLLVTRSIWISQNLYNLTLYICLTYAIILSSSMVAMMLALIELRARNWDHEEELKNEETVGASANDHYDAVSNK